MLHRQAGRIPLIAALLMSVAPMPAIAGSLNAAEGADASFADKVNLDKFRLVAVQHEGRFKTFDTLARSVLRLVSHDDQLERQAPGGGRRVKQDAAFTYLDLLFNPRAYEGVRLVFVKETEIRKQLVRAAKDWADKDTLDAILKDGRVSLAFLDQPEVRVRLEELHRDVMRTAKGVENLMAAAAYAGSDNLQRLMRVIPRAGSADDPWYSIADLKSLAPDDAVHAGVRGMSSLSGMDLGVQHALSGDWAALERAWAASDATAVNAALDSLAGRLARVAPETYPSQGKLALEHRYYKYNKMMWSWVFYFIAMVLLLMAAVYRWPRAAKVGVGFFIVAFLLHTAACAIRWYLAGHIPNVNMFEAVTAAAWLGAAAAIFFELGPFLTKRSACAWWIATTASVGGGAVWLIGLVSRGIPISAWQQWGPTAIAALIICAVGCMLLISLVVARRMRRAQGLALLAASGTAMVALMCGQFMKNSLDSDIGRPMPILNDLWLYVHTNMIIASYALIGMAFVTAALYVVGRMLTTPIEKAAGLWLSMLIPTAVIPLPALVTGITLRELLSAWAPFLLVLAMFAVAAVARVLWREGARRAYERWAGLPLGAAGVIGGGTYASCVAEPMGSDPDIGGSLEADRHEGLARVLDGATMLLLELSFIMLWIGIITGAIWADRSWGRPWGWDPKEVFALNTWIIFLILVHVRLKVKDRELWTAVLAVIGTSVMMFNWVVVNFFIVGLHSYA